MRVVAKRGNLQYLKKPIVFIVYGWKISTIDITECWEKYLKKEFKELKLSFYRKKNLKFNRLDYTLFVLPAWMHGSGLKKIDNRER